METNIQTDNIVLTIEDFYDPVAFQECYLKQKLHAKQIEVVRSPQKNKIIVCGRRSGKSQLIAGELIRGGISKQFPKQILIAPQYKQAIIVFEKIIELMTNAGVYHDIEKISQHPYPRVTFKNGTFINFGSADNPDSLRGEAYDRVFKDESAFIKKGADNAIKPLTYDKGAPVWETTTPWGKGEVWEKWIRGIKGDPDYGCFHYNYIDNPYLSDEGKKEIAKDIEEYGESSVYVQCEIYGNFVEDRDVYFPRDLIESCIDEISLGNAPHPNKLYYMGNDFARMGEDANVSIVIEATTDILKVVDIVERNKVKLTEIVGELLNLDITYNFQKIMLDSTGLGAGPSDLLQEKLGYKVEGIYFTIKSKQDMYSNLKKLMEQGKIKFPNHRKLIFQLMDLRYEVASGGNLKLHHSERGHDDFPDALVLACWACKEEEINYRPMLN